MTNRKERTRTPLLVAQERLYLDLGTLKLVNKSLTSLRQRYNYSHFSFAFDVLFYQLEQEIRRTFQTVRATHKPVKKKSGSKAKSRSRLQAPERIPF